ncbi:hypothetical protein NBRC116494_21190 [Aurantivibrio plasticivorans]
MSSTRSRQSLTWLSLPLVFAIGTISGCGEQEVQQPAPVASPVATAPAPEPQLPISLNELMVALVNQAADPIWVAAWKNPQSDEEWRRLEYLANQLEVAGSLLKIPGTGPMDKTWTSDARWQAFSDQLVQVGKQTLTAVGTRDIEAINLAGDDLVALCESCHIQFKPAIPTGNKYGELSPTE